jgi:hypothetical protein
MENDGFGNEANRRFRQQPYAVAQVEQDREAD